MNNNFFKKHFFFPGWLNTWRPYFLFFLIIFAVYGQTLFFQLTYLDDNTLILDKYDIIRDFKNLKIIFSTDAFFSDNRLYYRPMLNFSFMVDAQFGVLNYAVYHLSNLLWHFLAVSLVFLTFKRLFNRSNLALVGALFFAVHPALTQAVAWLPGRNDSLVAVFVLLSFWFFLNFFEGKKLSSFLAYLGFFALALLSKETSVFFPLLAIVYFFTLGRRADFSRNDKGLVIFGSLAAGFVWFLMRSFALDGGQVGVASALSSVWHNLPASLAMGAKMILPFNLAVLPIARDTSFIFSLIAWPAIILVFAFSRRKNWNYLIFGLAWFLVFFLPPFVISTGAPYLLEHRLYLPLIGFLIAIGSLDFIRELDWSRRKVFIPVAAVLILFSLITIIHSRAFNDPITFWQAAVKKSPHSPLAQRNLGAMYYLDGQVDKAIPYYQASLELNPQEQMVHNNLGVIYMDNNELDEAEQEFKKELEINPAYDKALVNLGEIYYRQERFIEAKYFWQEAFRINPYDPSPYFRLLKLDAQLNPGASAPESNN